MAFTKLEYGKVWTNETDFPTYQSDETQVRADLQYHPDAVKKYINEVLLHALSAKGAAADLGALNNGAAATVQTVLDAHKEDLRQLAEDIKTLAGGGTPSLVASASVSFFEESWASTGNGVSLTIAKTEHRRENANFGYNLYQYVSGVYRSGTWGAAATRAVYNADGSITLTADEAYSGRVVFFGM